MSQFTDGDTIVRVVKDDEENDDYDDNYLRKLEEPSNSDYNKNRQVSRPLSTTQKDSLRFS